MLPTFRPQDLADAVAHELRLPLAGVARTLELLAGGATVPFIARYRKEATGGLDDAAIQHIHDHAERIEALEKRRAAIHASLVDQGVLTPPLEAQVRAASTLALLEDLYLPFRPKRRTRASTARERGLQPLADRLLAQAPSSPSRDELARPFVDPAKEVADIEAAWAGARDIVAETVAERADVRAAVRQLFVEQGELTIDVARGKKAAPELAKFQDHVGRRERATQAPSHRVLAALRGETEGVLRVGIEVPPEPLATQLRNLVVARNVAPVLAREMALALADSAERLLAPALESELRRTIKEAAETEAIRVFAQNLDSLLLAPPLGARSVLAIDPGLRTGCKVVALDAQGNVQAQATIYPHTGQAAQAGASLDAMVKAHAPAAIAIGNGTAGRETESLVRQRVAAGGIPSTIPVVMVSEAGASVYSASELAREELPDMDVSVRGAVSIGRRLQDPLAELVKIDPQSIGVGQYQHDVDQSDLARALDRVVEAAVNRVGVDLNTASPTLLRYVAGLGPALAAAIVAHRAKSGPFRRRADLRDVPRLGAKAFEQAAGFLRIRDGADPLDASAVHPERYGLVARMAKDLGVVASSLLGQPTQVDRIEIKRYLDDGAGVGLPTLQDIVAELRKPGRDPRAEFAAVDFNPSVTELGHLQVGMILAGVVTNVAAFGAFVDIGVHQDGLVHVSELAHRFIKDPAEVVKVGDRVKVKVLTIDLARKRVGLSVKALQAGAAPAPSPSRPAPDARAPFNAPRRH